MAMRWRQQSTRIEHALNAAVSKRVDGYDTLATTFAVSQERAEAGKFDDALKILARLDGLLRQAGQATAAPAVPDGIVVFQKSKLAWEKTRKQMQAEMRRLQKSIVDRCNALGLTEVAADTEELFHQLGTIDESLEDALDLVINAEHGPPRDAEKAKASRAIDRYLAHLNTPFFKDLDTGNGFASVQVVGPAIVTLQAVKKRL